MGKSIQIAPAAQPRHPHAQACPRTGWVNRCVRVRPWCQILAATHVRRAVRGTSVLQGRPIVGYPVPTLYHILYVRAAKLVHAREGRPTLYLPCTDVPYFVCVPRQTKVGREVG